MVGEVVDPELAPGPVLILSTVHRTFPSMLGSPPILGRRSVTRRGEEIVLPWADMRNRWEGRLGCWRSRRPNLQKVLEAGRLGVLGRREQCKVFQEE